MSKKKINSKWRDGSPFRWDTNRTVPHVRWLSDGRGGKRLKIDVPNELEYCRRAHERWPWRHGAKVQITKKAA